MAEARFWRVRATSGPEVWLPALIETARAWRDLREHTLITACGPRQQLRRSAAVHVSFSDGTDLVLQRDVTRRWITWARRSAPKRKWRMMRFVTSHRGVCGGLIQ